jgi:hypothetical protein
MHQKPTFTLHLFVLSLFPAVLRSTDMSFCSCSVLLFMTFPRYLLCLFSVCHALILVTQLFRLDTLLIFTPCIPPYIFYLSFYLVFIVCSCSSSSCLYRFSLAGMYCTITHISTNYAPYHHPATCVRRLPRVVTHVHFQVSVLSKNWTWLW